MLDLSLLVPEVEGKCHIPDISVVIYCFDKEILTFSF